MKAESQRDLLGEGIRPEGIEYSLELDIARTGHPAVLEGVNSTYFVPEGWTLEMDQFGNAKATRES